MRSLMVQGTSSGAGKSTLVAALCRIFSDRGLSVAPFKSQNMSRHSYRGRGFEISRAQAVQAAAARAEPEPDMNPILLKPRGGGASAVYLNGRRLRAMGTAEYYRFARRAGLRAALAAAGRLAAGRDLLVMEGAGSPAEVNIGADIANMGIAERTRSPVVLVTDVDRGGSFASLAGTMSLLAPAHRRLVRGFVFNKFRGDERILRRGFARLRRETGRGVLGVVPMARVRLPDEDSLDPREPAFEWDGPGMARLDAEIGRLARLVARSLDVRALERMALGR